MYTEKYKERIVKYLRDAKNPKYKRSFNNIIHYLNVTSLDIPKIFVAIRELLVENILINKSSSEVAPGSDLLPDMWLEYNPYPKKALSD